ncbi:MAG: very short patch repair endonuclease [Coriobacteriia bacterium]
MAMSRSDNMRRIRSRDTEPELAVRRILRSQGFTGYRLHRKDVPGKPDIVFLGRKKAILVHGCFWHGHDCAEGSRKPKSNQDYWVPKLDRNRERDVANAVRLTNAGWSAMIVWECELKDTDALARRFRVFMAEADG